MLNIQVHDSDDLSGGIMDLFLRAMRKEDPTGNNITYISRAARYRHLRHILQSQ